MSYRLKIKVGKGWKIGLIKYSTYEEAVARVNELKAMKSSMKIQIVDNNGGKLI